MSDGGVHANGLVMSQPKLMSATQTKHPECSATYCHREHNDWGLRHTTHEHRTQKLCLQEILAHPMLRWWATGVATALVAIHKSTHTHGVKGTLQCNLSQDAAKCTIPSSASPTGRPSWVNSTEDVAGCHAQPMTSPSLTTGATRRTVPSDSTIFPQSWNATRREVGKASHTPGRVDNDGCEMKPRNMIINRSAGRSKRHNNNPGPNLVNRQN
jgi:hypothetical protein